MHEIISDMSESITNGIRVVVKSQYMPGRSNPVHQMYYFAYFVTIRNESDRPVQLMSRHWQIRDALGRIEEVEGPGVIGQQPVILPGDYFEYSSFCPLRTEYGHMNGSYRMQTDDGELFDAEIARFQLISPQSVN